MLTQLEKAKLFKALHEGSGSFIIPNPWDIASARLLEHLGFQALATSSAGFAFSIAQRDNAVSRERTLAHLRELTTASDLPISADLGNCFGEDPAVVAETIRLAAEAGVVGGSVEDSTGQAENPIYDFNLSVERVHAAVEAARALSFPFTLTARAENYFVGHADLDDTLRRLQAFQAVGADVAFPHGMIDRDAIAAVTQAVDCPINILMGAKENPFNLEVLEQLGVKRVSVGIALFMAGMSAVLRAGREMRAHGSFTFIQETEDYRELIRSIFPEGRKG